MDSGHANITDIDDTIEVRHHVFIRTGYDSVELSEVGPRMSMKLFEIRNGTRKWSLELRLLLVAHICTPVLNDE